MLNNAQIKIIQDSLQFEMDYIDDQLSLPIALREDEKSNGDLAFRQSEIMAAQQALLKVKDRQALTIE